MKFEKRENEGVAFLLLRWSARLLSIEVVILVMLFAFGNEGTISGVGIKGREYIGFLFFPVGMMVGFIIGWKNELLGGSISTASLVCFYLVYEAAIMGRIPRGPWFAAFNIPGFLFLTYGVLRHRFERVK